MLIFQGQMYITKKEVEYDEDYVGGKYVSYMIGKKNFKEQYLKQMSEFGTPIIEYWTYFPTKGLPKELHINNYQGDAVHSVEEVPINMMVTSKGDEWIINAHKQHQFKNEEKDEHWIVKKIKSLWNK